MIKIILTGYTDTKDLMDAINQGRVYKYITKPFRPNDLHLIVKRALEHYELENDNIKAVKTVPNSAINAMGGAGVQATQIIGNNDANAVIVGFLGPNAANGLKALNIKIFQAPNEAISIKEVINLYIQGKLQTMNTSNVASHYGMGGGRGRGMGRGNQP